ncbi:hypothetical protein N8367_03400 [Amylibacter sp.]|nr:hypothetical protein [Amylibacter sp.]
MRKLIDIVKQQSFDAPLESTLEDLTTLSTAVKDLSDRINTRTKKSLNPNDKVKAKKVNPFPSVKPLPIPQSKNTPSTNDKLQTLKQYDFNKQRDDFVDRQQAVQSIKPQSTVPPFSK